MIALSEIQRARERLGRSIGQHDPWQNGAVVKAVVLGATVASDR